MAVWVGDGWTSGFVRVVDTVGTRPAVAAFNNFGYKLATNAVVDLQGDLRLQYEITDVTMIFARTTFDIEAADVAANPGWVFTSTYFLAYADDLPATPTQAQIIAAAFVVARAKSPGFSGDPYYRTNAGRIEGDLYESASRAWVPNKKLWLVAVPTRVIDLIVPPGVGNDIPLGDPNVIGRAVSLWTNRTPQAPAIVAPLPQSSVFAGSEIQFTFRPNDPDRVTSFSGDTRPTDFDDVAGVQIQYAPKPTIANPTPAWTDIPITNTLGTATNRGWYIKYSASEPANDGAKALWQTYGIKIRCGSTTLTPGTANLPSGNWQIRVRTFDYGHPAPSTISPVIKPLNDASGLYTPDSYPAVNTSPWSTPVNISISEQVPPPVPLTPINNVAVPLGSAINLTWQYRNTYVPPKAQLQRLVQIREVGSPTWTIVAFGVSSSPTLLVTSGLFTFVPGTHYEWRVQVSDTSGVMSAFSELGRFWVVPAPQSGEVRPVPGETIDGATLGCGTHRVEIYRRGGLVRIGELKQITHLDWARVRDDISTAQIVVSGWDIDCGNLLAKLQTWAYEVVITRDNGYSKDRVWEGPITLLTYETDKVTIDAKDVMGYAYRRIIKQAMNDVSNPTPVTTRATQVIQNAFAPDDPNVLAYLNTITQPDDPMQQRSTPAYSRTAFEEVDDMAANAGLDYTAIGRSILLWSTRHRIGTLPEFDDSNLGSPPIVSEYGMSMSNYYVVSDGNGTWGAASRLDVSGNDETYGLVEMLSSTWASDTADEVGTLTNEEREKAVEKFEEYAERSIADRYPPPVVVRIPDNTTLNPNTVLSIQQLVPGVAIPLRSTGTLRNVVALQKLDSVKVTEEAGKETITIVLSPFNEHDIEEGSE